MVTTDQTEFCKSGIAIFRSKFPIRSPVIISGCSRGGTSLAAAIFRTIGFDMGSRLAENHEDPLFHNVFYPTFDELRFENRFRSKEMHPWGFKLPKAAIYLEKIDALVHDVHPCYVFIFRSAFDAAKGESKRGGNFTNSLYFSTHFYKEMSSFLKSNLGTINAIAIDYSAMARNPGGTAKDLCSIFGIDWTEEMERAANAASTGEGGGYLNMQ